MTDDLDPWNYNPPPYLSGWYAVLYSWEAHEGIFPGARYWDGNSWSPKRPMVIGWSLLCFDNEHDALGWADDHDPDN